jgi:putative copper resistance protein D
VPIDLTVIFLRWLQFASAVAALGLPLFQTYPSGTASLPSELRMAVLAGLLLSVGAAGGLVAQTAMMAGGWTAGLDPAALGYVIQSTGFGMAHVARAGLALFGVVILLIGRGRRSMTATAVVAFAGAVASFAWSGHGASSEGSAGAVHLVADIIHALAAAVWLGALAGFCLMLARPLKGEIEESARSLAGFATVGTATVAVLTVTGLVNSAFLVGLEGSGRLASSAWGLLLLAKLGLFAVMVWLAAHNRYVLTPELDRAIAQGSETGDPVKSLRISIGLELAAGVVLLGLVAAMGVQMPPASM